MSKIKWKDRPPEYKEGWEDGATFIKFIVYGLLVLIGILVFIFRKL